MYIPSGFDNYPVKTVLIVNFHSLSVYLTGLYILFIAGSLFAVMFALYLFGLEIRLLKNHCANCYYYGKRCGFGKGKISSRFFKKGDQAKFCTVLSWKDMLPDLFVSLIPLVAGIVLLILDFRISILISMIVILLLSTVGNAHIRGKIICNDCRQRDLGCPAFELFNKAKN